MFLLRKYLIFHEVKTKITLHFKPTISYCRNVGLNCEQFKFTDNKYNFPSKKYLPNRILIGLLIWKFQYLKARRPRVTHHWTFYGSKYNSLYENLGESRVRYLYMLSCGTKEHFDNGKQSRGIGALNGLGEFLFQGLRKGPAWCCSLCPLNRFTLLCI